MTTYIRWLPHDDVAVRAAYEALDIGETIQTTPNVLTDGTYLVGSSVLTEAQAETLPIIEHSSTWKPEWVVQD